MFLVHAVRPGRSSRALCISLILALACAGQANAQSDDNDEVSSPVVQQIPGDGSMRLNAALGRLGRNPGDVAALTDAGRAALEMGDVDAAIGFFQRADALSPGNAKVKAGLAGAYVRSGDPFKAIPLFSEAELAGSIEPVLLVERGLAYDLVGDNETAQQHYRTALAAGSNDEATRRLALSQAIYGDRRAMEATLAPLLQRQDKAAWRTRAFSFAILGLTDEAESIARSVMPADLAAAITPYLRYMPRLTPAQQAGAASSGRFPRAAEIGLDDPRVAQYAKPRRTLAMADRALVPAGKPMGRDSKASNSSRSSRSDRGQPAATALTAVRATAPLVPVPTRELAAAPVQLAANAAKPPVVQPRPVQMPVAQPPAIKPAIVARVPDSPAKLPANAQSPSFASLDPVGPKPVTSAPPEPTPGISGFDLARVSPASAPIEPPAVAKPPAAVAATKPVAVPQPRSLADVFADLGTPSREAVPTAGAVDMRRIAPARPAIDPKDIPICKPGVTGKAAANCKAAAPPPPSHPSRIWVQLATGRDKRALGFDWRKMVRDEAETIRSRKGFTSSWGQSNRLLTGPFESESAATAFVSQLRRAGVAGSFFWTSPAGQIVDAVPGK